jgi:hypothetical protein
MTSTLQFKATASSSPLQGDFLVQGDFLDAPAYYFTALENVCFQG